MIDSVDLVHMNGRIYDPEIGRFLSADPPRAQARI
jgi:RHS repeat-associated protein